MRLQKRWYLGFLGLIGIYKFNDSIAAFSGSTSWIEALSLGWLIWFLYFLPEKIVNSNK